MRANNPNAKIKEQYAGLTEGVKWNGQIRLMEKNLDLPLRVKKPQVWAVWNDLFHDDVPFWFIDDFLDICERAKQHTVLVLTKRIKRAYDYFDSTSNRVEALEKSGIWLGVTAENQAMADERIPVLLQIPAAVRFVSVEPMLGSVDLTMLRDKEGDILDSLGGCYYSTNGSGSCLDWATLDLVICGTESGPNRRKTPIDCIRNLRDQCAASGTNFFLKQMEIEGRLVKMPVLDGKVWSQWPEVQQ
jgi:protein gp37